MPKEVADNNANRWYVGDYVIARGTFDIGLIIAFEKSVVGFDAIVEYKDGTTSATFLGNLIYIGH